MKLFRRIDYWMNRRKRDAELAEELEYHRSQLGAKTGAVELGNTTRAREDARAIWIWPWFESITQDIRYAIRNLRKQPGFALVAIATLGLAIGLNTSLFTVFNAVAIRMWPVKDPSRLVKIFLQTKRGPRGFSLAEYRYLNQHARSLNGVIALADARVHLGFEAFGKVTMAGLVPDNYFQVLGVPMERGRGFAPEENVLDAPEHVMVLSYAVWRDHYGSDPTILGRELRVSEVPFTVIGVAAEQFTGSINAGSEGVWVPMAALPLFAPNGNTENARSFLVSPNDCCSGVAGRLAPGVSRSQAEAELTVLSRQFHAENHLEANGVTLTDATLLAGHSKRKSLLPVFGLMFVGVMLVLLLACTNVSNLLIARAAARQREIEVRRAIGAGRARIIRQLLTEGSVLAVLASMVGIALAWRLPEFIFVQMGEGPNIPVTPDAGVIGYTVALAAISCLAFGLAPALHGTRPNGSRNRLPLRNILLGAQVAMSVVLLIGAGLMVASIQHARSNDPGFRIADVNVISVQLPARAYDEKRLREFAAQLVTGLDGIGASRFGVTAREPLANSHWNTEFRRPSEPPDTAHDIEYQEVSGGYFDVLGIPIIMGRTLKPADLTTHAIVINETMAKRYFEGQNPLGQTIITGKQSREIVGVARDAYLTGLERFVPLFFQPFSGEGEPRVMVRADAPGALEIVTQVTTHIEPRARIHSAPLSENLDRLLSGSRVMAGIAGMLGGFALVLAVIGMSGVFAYVVQQRTKEIGIRMALGADPKQVIGLVLMGTARAAIIGLAIGFIATAAVAKLMADYLYGVSPYDPRAYAGVAMILAISGLAAAYLPARRATKVDPLTALRVE